MFVYCNVHGSQSEFVERVTRVFILRMCSRGENGPLRRKTVCTVASIPNTMARIHKLGGLLEIRGLFKTEISAEQGYILPPRTAIIGAQFI